MISFIKKNFALLLILMISAISHWYIFFDLKILSAGDWTFHYNSHFDSIKNYALYLSTFNLGTIMALSSNWIFYIFYYLLGLIGISWDIGSRILFLAPIIFLTPLFSFLLFKKILKNDLISFFSSCLYSFNTIFLKIQLDFLTYGFIWWILPALFLNILNYLETKNSKYLVYNALLVFIGIVYEPRIMILVLIFLASFQIAYLIIGNNRTKERIKNNIYIFISYGGGFLMHSFWLIPIMTGLGKDVMTQAAPGLFGSYFNLLDVLTLHMYSWSNNLAMEPFSIQPIELRYFLIPITAVIGVIVFKKLFKNKKHDLYFMFFGVSLLVSVFLGKQEFAPFREFYGWAFHNVPLFNLFRESSKFLMLTALSLSFFFGIGLFYIYSIIKKRNYKIAVLVITIILFFSSVFNLQHFFTQKIGYMTKGVEIPNDYKILEKKLSSDNEYYRILWLPIRHRFSFNSETHPFLNMTDLVNILKERTDFTLFDGSSSVSDQLLFLLKQQYSDQLLNNASVKYVIVPIAEKREKKLDVNNSKWVYEIFEHFGPRQFFVTELDKIDYLKRIDMGTQELAIYENVNYMPHIYSNSRIDYIQSDFTDLGSFSQNQAFYFDAKLESRQYLLNSLDNIIIPISPDSTKANELRLLIKKTLDPQESRELKTKLNFYINDLSLDNYSIKIIKKSVYKIYINNNSILNDNKDLTIKIDNYLLENDEDAISRGNWKYFNQIELNKGDYGFNIYIKDKKLKNIHPGDIILSAENLLKPIGVPKLEYKQISPTKYAINVNGAASSFPLIFSEAFHPDWKIYVNQGLSDNQGDKFISENNQGTIQNDNLDGGRFYDVFSRKPVLDGNHFQINGFANAWWIDIENIKSQISNLKSNPDGSIDFELIIEFEPQKYFYLGLAISGITLLGCLGYLGFTLLNDRAKKRKKGRKKYPHPQFDQGTL